MKLLEEKIKKDGEIIGGIVLKVENSINFRKREYNQKLSSGTCRVAAALTIFTLCNC